MIPFDVKLVQMVQLLRNGEPAKMSKRSGNFVTIADMVEEVGKDVVRFTMLTRKPEAQMDFDFAKVVEAVEGQSGVLCPICPCPDPFDPAQGGGRRAGCRPDDAARRCSRADELALVAQAAQFPREVEAAASAREPHRIAFYLYDLAAAFHGLLEYG